MSDSDPLAVEASFDPGAAPVTCPGCGQRVVLVVAAGESDAACPLCRGRESATRSLDDGAVAIGPWPRLALRRGPPLAGGALSCGVPGAEAVLAAPDGPLARLRREGERLWLWPLVAGARVDGADVATGEERELRVGARLVVAGRELSRD